MFDAFFTADREFFNPADCDECKLLPLLIPLSMFYMHSLERKMHNELLMISDQFQWLFLKITRRKSESLIQKNERLNERVGSLTNLFKFVHTIRCQSQNGSFVT